MRHLRMIGLIALASLFGACTNGEDYGEALCERQLSDPALCEGGGACGAAIGAASAPEGPCADELAAMIEATPASYMTCSNACPAQATCTIGDTVINLRSCSCQTACIRESTEEYRTAISAYVACLDAQEAVASNCY